MKKILILLIMVVMLCFSFFFEVPETLNVEYIRGNEKNEALKYENMKIYVPSLDNGRCVIVRLPTDEWILIDCGSSEDFPVIYEKLRKMEVNIIDFIVFTSSEDCALGGIDKILSNFKVSQIFCSTDMKNSQIYNKINRVSSNSNVLLTCVSEGSRIYDFDNICIDVVSAEKYFLGDEVNSVSLYIIYGNRGIFVEGECDISSEAKMAAELKNSIKSDVFVTPYGARQNIQSNYFIEEIAPDYTVISVLDGNNPLASYVEPLSKSEVYRTDINGDINFTISEENIRVKLDR